GLRAPPSFPAQLDLKIRCDKARDACRWLQCYTRIVGFGNMKATEVTKTHNVAGGATLDPSTHHGWHAFRFWSFSTITGCHTLLQLAVSHQVH
ncbi:hypothetical protein E2562_033478, partial [Oryza meyeriana var. granulata]